MDWFTGLEAFQQERRVVEESSKVNLKATEPCKGRKDPHFCGETFIYS